MRYALTVLSYGAGQESTTILLRLINEPAFYKKHVSGHLIVVGSDTGDEHPHTYDLVKEAQRLCKSHKIPFFWVTPKFGFHSKSWQSLFFQYKKTSTIGSAAFQQTCTDNLKVKVIDNFIENYIQTVFHCIGKRKNAYHDFAKRFGKIKLLLGFAKGEESRTTNGNKFDAVWKKATVERFFPLIEEQWGRQECIDYNETVLSFTVFPSNCMRCFYQSEQEILWLYRNYPAKFNEWVRVEKAKLIKWKHKELEEPPKNYGVYGLKSLKQKLERALKLYGHWTDEQLNEYKYSHGHCIKSKY